MSDLVDNQMIQGLIESRALEHGGHFGGTGGDPGVKRLRKTRVLENVEKPLHIVDHEVANVLIKRRRGEHASHR